VLNAPAGFTFNPNSAASVVVIPVGSIQSGNPTPVTVPVTVTPTTVTLTVSGNINLNGAGACTLLFQNIQARPAAGSPLASGYITQSGTGSFQNIVNLTGNWGFLKEIGGTLVGYRITGFNNGTAGSPISITIQKVDEFGNPLGSSGTETLTFSGMGAIGANAPSVNGSTAAFTTGITVTFYSNGTATVTLIDYLAGNTTLNLTDGTYTGGSGLPISIQAGPASALSISGAPNFVTYGSSFGLVVNATDQYGNLSTVGLGTSTEVALSLISGSGTLIGNLTQDIGTGAGNGTASFTGIQINEVGNYFLSVNAAGLAAGTAPLSVTPLVVTPFATVANKTYDGTTAGTIINRSLGGVIGGDDVNLGGSGVATFVDKHVGTAKPVLVTGLALSGSTAGNYQLSTTSVSTTASIEPRQLQIAADSQTKLYDGTAVSTAMPMIAHGSLAPGDACSLSQHFNNKEAAPANPLIPNGSIDDGNGGLDYSVTFVSTNGVIQPRPITVTAVADTKLYDGTTTSAGIPVVTGTLASGDTANFSQSFDNKNIGTQKALLPSGSVNDGNGGNNYIVTFVSKALGTITAHTLTVSAVTDTKVYDGNSNSALTPALTSGSLLSGDVANFVQNFDNKNAGTGKLLTPTGSVNDGNGGNNYIISFVSAAGTITPRNLTVTAVADSKTYDGNAHSGAQPILSSGILAEGDIASFVQNFDTKNAGVGKILSPTGIVNDGNSGANYNIAVVSVNNGGITPRALAVTATGVNKLFDGTTAATVVLSDNRISGDSLAESYAVAAFYDASAGNNKPVQVSGITVLGVDASNYSPNTSTTALANITQVGPVVTLTSSKNPIVEGENVSFTAKLAATATLSAMTTGTVQFYANGQPLGGPVTLNGAAATINAAQLPMGSNTVSAVYLGDSNFQSSSATMVQAVQMNVNVLKILSIVENGDGTTTVTCQGEPATSYVVQASTALNSPTAWEPFSTNTSGYIDGKWTIVDDMTKHQQRFFRLVKF